MKFSYSRLATYKQCPAKFRYAYIDKVPVDEGPPAQALVRGSAVHDSVEAFLLGTNEFLHPDIHKAYGQWMFSLREDNSDLRPEFKWGVTWEFEACDYDASDCMLRGFVDLLVVPEDEKIPLPVYEWKTGGIYQVPHRHQTWIYAVAMMVHFPDRPSVETTITYFDKQDYDKIEYFQGMMGEYKHLLRNEINEVVDATRYPAMPSFKCKWCKFSRANGGPCQF